MERSAARNFLLPGWPCLASDVSPSLLFVISCHGVPSWTVMTGKLQPNQKQFPQNQIGPIAGNLQSTGLWTTARLLLGVVLSPLFSVSKAEVSWWLSSKIKSQPTAQSFHRSEEVFVVHRLRARHWAICVHRCHRRSVHGRSMHGRSMHLTYRHGRPGAFLKNGDSTWFNQPLVDV